MSTLYVKLYDLPPCPSAPHPSSTPPQRGRGELGWERSRGELQLRNVTCKFSEGIILTLLFNLN